MYFYCPTSRGVLSIVRFYWFSSKFLHGGFYLLAEFVDVDTFGGGVCAYLREGDVLVSTGCGRALVRRFAAVCVGAANVDAEIEFTHNTALNL